MLLHRVNDGSVGGSRVGWLCKVLISNHICPRKVCEFAKHLQDKCRVLQTPVLREKIFLIISRERIRYTCIFQLIKSLHIFALTLPVPHTPRTIVPHALGPTCSSATFGSSLTYCGSSHASCPTCSRAQLPCALRVPYVPCALRALVFHVSCVLSAFVPRLPHMLRVLGIFQILMHLMSRSSRAS